jgi:predicted ribosomally synthesized peptide with nif11-like leader
MSDEQLKAFLEAIQGDIVLQERLKAAVAPDTIVAIAKEAGFAISEANVKAGLQHLQTELSDEELESVAGGYIRPGGNCAAPQPQPSY